MEHVQLFENFESFNDVSPTSFKMKLFKDTLSGKLEWKNIDTVKNNLFITKVKLENPKDAYLEIHVTRPFYNWKIIVYYVRRDKDGNLNEKGIEIQKTEDESRSTLALIKKIKEKLGIGDPEPMVKVGSGWDVAMVKVGDSVIFIGRSDNVLGLINRAYKIVEITDNNVIVVYKNEKMSIVRPYFEKNFEKE